MPAKNILIISYVFPPYPGIGGRRWAKFAKYLHRAGHNVYVIAAQNPFDKISTFINDIQELPEENLFYLSAQYPTILLKQPATLWEKIQYHFWINTLPFFTKGNFYDRTIFWKNQLHQQIEKLIQEKHINTIIVSGPPFNYVYQTILLKKKFPDVKFVVDYRDEWTFNDVHGWGLLSEKRKQEEFRKEQHVCENADLIISCHEVILEYVNKKYSCKCFTLIPHGYDKDDFNTTIHVKKISSETITISYFGTIYASTEKFFTELSAFLNKLKKENPDIYNKLFFNFYTIDYFHYYEHIRTVQNKIRLIENLLPSDLFARIQESNYVLLLPPFRAKDYFTSKFPEIFYLKKPIILYSDNGKVSEFITKHKIGVHLPKENFYDALLNALQHPEQFNYNNFNLQEWDYLNITEKLIETVFLKL